MVLAKAVRVKKFRVVQVVAVTAATAAAAAAAATAVAVNAAAAVVVAMAASRQPYRILPQGFQTHRAGVTLGTHPERRHRGRVRGTLQPPPNPATAAVAALGIGADCPVAAGAAQLPPDLAVTVRIGTNRAIAAVAVAASVGPERNVPTN